MHDVLPATAISPLRQRLIDDMSLRRFSQDTQRNDIRDVGRLATFLGRRLDTASAEDLRRFQVAQREAGVPVPTLNGIVSALRFFFTHTLDRPDLARRLVRLAYTRTLPVVLGRDEVAGLRKRGYALATVRTSGAPTRYRIAAGDPAAIDATATTEVEAATEEATQ